MVLFLHDYSTRIYHFFQTGYCTAVILKCQSPVKTSKCKSIKVEWNKENRLGIFSHNEEMRQR